MRKCNAPANLKSFHWPSDKKKGSIYLAIHLCLPPLFFPACLSCIVFPAQYWDTAKLSSCTTGVGEETARGSGWHAAQIQVNTSRDCATAVAPSKCLHSHPTHPKEQEPDPFSPVSHIMYAPNSCIQLLGKLFTKEPQSDTQEALSRFYFGTPRTTAASQWVSDHMSGRKQTGISSFPPWVMMWHILNIVAKKMCA